MLVTQSPITIADYCAAFKRKELIVNHEYQRSDKVWPVSAKSFLIETIILGYPIPKLFLRQNTDIKSRKTIKEIVDGQQRSSAIFDFYENRLSISKKSEVERIQGKKYDDLDDTDKAQFLSYQLSVDLFTSVTTAEIREAFRRLNSYTVPLNPEELRNAQYQGEFKWFIYEMAQRWDEWFKRFGVFGDKQIVRMQDAKLLTEFSDSLLHGIRTTKAKQLNDVYRNYDKPGSFHARDDLDDRINKAMNFIGGLTELHQGSLMKPYVFYTLMIAVTHRLAPVQQLVPVVGGVISGDIDRGAAVANLSALAAALDEETPTDFSEFVQSCKEKTNVAAQRVMRSKWLYRALSSQSM